MSSALVLLSGGQDSFTSFYWAKKNFEKIYAMSFDYGQRHKVELGCAEALCARENVEWTSVDLQFLNSLNSNALTNPAEAILPQGSFNNLPSTFVPGRNILFLSVAASWALPRGISHLVIGACETDYSGYPDCRENFMKKMAVALSAGLDSSLEIHTPLMHLTKAQTFELARELEKLEDVLELSHTCYAGERSVRHAWGYGCGECPACVLRRKGYEEFIEQHELSEVTNYG
jgi:7-cyano-7-deazaguanine synthase